MQLKIKRVKAVAIDLSIIVFSLLILMIINQSILEYKLIDINKLNNSLTYQILFVQVTHFLYFFLSEFISKGYTLGKKQQVIRVISLVRENVTLKEFFIRSLILPFEMYTGIGILFIIFRKDSRRLGDILSSTSVKH